MTDNTFTDNRDARALLSEFKFKSNYAKYNEKIERLETWEESVDRVFDDMHGIKYKEELEKSPRLRELYEFARTKYKQKFVLGSQRALQFGGKPILKHNAKMYNCLSTYADRPKFFQETMYWLLCGCGVGFSVQKHHVAKIPSIKKRTNRSKVFVIEDSIEGWSDAIGVLISSYLEEDVPFPKFQGCHVNFDYSKIRPKGSMISGGFKAPGHEGLRASILKIEELLEKEVNQENFNGKIRPIVAYDIVMHMSDAVLSGGVRRSATICLFSPTDNEMLNAKTGDWLEKNPQRARSNNSVLLKKDEISKEDFSKIMESVKQFGEPGFVFTEDLEIMYNPCVEIGMYPQMDGVSGFQGCNLCEINGGACETEELFYEACEAAAIIGTLQAGYTDFRYVDEISKKIFDREALLGCSITGFMSNPDILLNPEIQRKGAEIIKLTNEIVANLIGINPAARSTCVKPSGNASVLLETASGIHGEDAPMYFRNVQVNMDEDLGKFIKENAPKMVEDSVWSASGTDWVVSFPIRTNNKSIFKEDLYGTELLEYVKLTQQNWVEAGTVVERCAVPTVRHNVSNTIVVDNWDRVENYIYENRKWFAGISLLPMTGANDYAQAPFTAVHEAADLIDMYGDAMIFASGLIVDGLNAFNNNLWKACDTVLGFGEKLDYSEEEVEAIISATSPEELWSNLGFKNGTLATLTSIGIKPEVEEYKRYMDSKLPNTVHNYVMKKDWIRRAKQFAKRYFSSVKEMTYCLKDVNNYHRWIEIERELPDLDFSKFNQKPEYVDIDTTGAVACSGVQCEVTF